MPKPIKKTDIGKPWLREIAPRRVGVRPQRTQILLVCEDTKSAVLYFEQIQKMLPQESITLYPVGTGMNTQSLVNEVASIRKHVEQKRGVDFDEVWVLFDKDSFDNAQFDNAISSGEAKRYKVAWSNECFELWYLLHFQDLSAGIGRQEIYRKLQKCLGVRNYAEQLKGEKGRELHQLFAINKAARLMAIKRAKRLDKMASGAYHTRNPVTKVYLLFEHLEPWIRE